MLSAAPAVTAERPIFLAVDNVGNERLSDAQLVIAVRRCVAGAVAPSDYNFFPLSLDVVLEKIRFDQVGVDGRFSQCLLSLRRIVGPRLADCFSGADLYSRAQACLERMHKDGSLHTVADAASGYPLAANGFIPRGQHALLN